MLDKLFRVHSEKNGAAMNGTASTKEGPPNGVRRALSDVDVEVIVQAGLDQSVHTTKSKNLRRGSIQSRKRVAKKQPSPHGLPSFYQHQAGGNHQPPDRQQSMDNCKCTIC